ncbi:MAG: type II secretion system F family protein [Vulcanimicrobiaceae bacterium]
MTTLAPLAPFAIFLGISATFVLVFFSFWSSLNTRATQRARGLHHHLDRADITMKAEEIVLSVVGIAALLWTSTMLALRPTLPVGLLLIPAFIAATAGLFYAWIQFRIKRRIEAFVQQLELALRLIASGVRVGLGLRQAFTLVIEELPDPAKREFMRVIGQTNIGVSILDAVDDLAERMPSNETLMMARVIRVQSQTGGDLGKVLEHLAGTIKDRRRIHRKIGSLTAEGRMSCLVLMLIPPLLGAFICISQPPMGHALLFTRIGHTVLFILAILELGGFIWLQRILKVDV